MMTLSIYEPWGLLPNILPPHLRYTCCDTEQAEGYLNPAVDIQETKDRFIIHADLPGIDPKDIEITVDKDVLTLKGKRQKQSEVKEANYRRVERVSGVFYRSFRLPAAIDAENIQAKGENGVLEITVNRLKAPEPRRINVQS